jgi:hypothetical protein
MKNGHILNRKQNHQCLSLSKQIVLKAEKKSISEENKAKKQ